MLPFTPAIFTPVGPHERIATIIVKAGPVRYDGVVIEEGRQLMFATPVEQPAPPLRAF